MNPEERSPTRAAKRAFAAAATAAFALVAAAFASAETDPCRAWSGAAHMGCRRQAQADYWVQRAVCANLPTPQERAVCAAQALEDLEDAFDTCGDQFDARCDLCDALGGGIYHPLIDPSDFVPVIDNPYLPFVAGTTFVYEKETDEGLEHTEIVVTHETKEILGVTCTVVHDIESLDGETIEDTFDWFAQDQWGNVWYFGELSFEYEDGEIAGTGGSWKAGEDGAEPGIVMQGAPQVGDVYRQEFLIGEAEDAAAVLGLAAAVNVPYGSFSGCLKTEDITPLEPDALEHKFYAPGVGLVLEVDVDSGERNELIDIQVE
jgi:hypothetical protein